MRVIARGRQQGKTRDLIIDSAASGATIICPNEEMVDYTKRMSKDMGIDIPTPLSFQRFPENLRGTGIKNIMIDNADIILRNMFRPYNILEVTLSDE